MIRERMDFEKYLLGTCREGGVEVVVAFGVEPSSDEENRYGIGMYQVNTSMPILLLPETARYSVAAVKD